MSAASPEPFSAGRVVLSQHWESGMGMFASALRRFFKPRPEQAGETADASVGAIIRLLKGKRDEGVTDLGPNEPAKMPDPAVVVAKSKPSGG